MQTPMEAKAEYARALLARLEEIASRLDHNEPEDIRYWSGQRDMVDGIIGWLERDAGVLEGEHRP